MFHRRSPQSPNTAIPDAVRYLASVCDGAVKRDGLGFAADHVAYGHWLARLPLNQWGPEEYRHGRTIAIVYRNQLIQAGLAFS